MQKTAQRLKRGWQEAKTSVAADSFESLSNAAASTGEGMDSIADVKVTGVGSIATLNAADTSVFTTNIETRQRAILPDNNGTATVLQEVVCLPLRSPTLSRQAPSCRHSVLTQWKSLATQLTVTAPTSTPGSIARLITSIRTHE